MNEKAKTEKKSPNELKGEKKNEVRTEDMITNKSIYSFLEKLRTVGARRGHIQIISQTIAIDQEVFFG